MRIGIVFLVVVVAAATTVLHAAEIQVGGDTGWRVPPNPSFYSSWAASQNFTVRDVLVFNFPTGGHDVAGVTKDGYDNCITDNPKFLNNTSPFSFTLDTVGDFYFICTVPGHCSGGGQKLAITNVQQPSSSSAPPPPAIPNSPPGPVSGGEPTTTMAPPPPNSASSILASIFTVAFASIAATLIIF